MQDVQHQDHFIGRAGEIEAFQHWLADPTSPWILYIHDAAEQPEKKGGVGKTWLLRKYAEYVRREQGNTAVVMADFFNVSDRDRHFLAQKIVTELEALYKEWKATAFNQATQLYRNPTTTVGSESNENSTREEISAALTEDLRRLDIYLGEQQKTLLVILDTFETLEQNPSVAVLRQAQTFPDNYAFAQMRVVIAGRNRLDWTHPNWRDREQEVQVLALEPFSQQETQQYIETESIYDIPAGSEAAGAFYERTEGRPIIIGLAIDVLNHRILKLQDLVTVSRSEFESYLVPQVNKLENPLNWVILFMAHVYHRFNMPILECILKGVELNKPVLSISQAELSRLLPELSFVRQSGVGNDFVLHDEMRRLVTRYCWEELDPDRRYRKDISRSIISYCEQDILRTQNEQEHQRYSIEILYHRMFVDSDDGLRYFQQQFIRALRFVKTAFARLLWQEVQGFSTLLPFAQQNDVRLSEVKLFRAEDNAAPALILLRQLRLGAGEQWCAAHQIDLLLEEGRCYTRQSRLLEAANCFKQCLEIAQARGDEQDSASYLTHLGLLARRRGEFATALNYYEQSIAILKKTGQQNQYATTLMNTATVYRRQGKIEEALRRCKIAWQIRLSLFRAGEISENLVGSSMHVLGQIYLDASNVIEAEHYFNQAFNIFLRNGNKSSIATIYNRFGAVQLAKGELEGARIWFVKGQEASQNVNTEQYINSLNKQGRVYLRKLQWAEAAVLFEQAINTAHHVPDYFQETESLIDLAIVLQQMDQGHRAQQLLLEAEAIANRENYNALLGLIEQERAEVCYKKTDYTQAFQHFVLYCQRMLRYNYTSFVTAVQKVGDALIGVPADEVRALTHEMRTYWTLQHLDSNYPELIEACEEVENFML